MKAPILLVAAFLTATVAQADNCMTFIADPDHYTASTSWTVNATFSNCGDSWLLGDSYGTSNDAADSWLFDPFILLGPGDSTTVPFAQFTWLPGTPEGFTWTGTIVASYGFLSSPSGSFVGNGISFASFTATHDPPPVPEASTMALLATGLAGMWLAAKRTEEGI